MTKKELIKAIKDELQALKKLRDEDVLWEDDYISFQNQVIALVEQLDEPQEHSDFVELVNKTTGELLQRAAVAELALYDKCESEQFNWEIEYATRLISEEERENEIKRLFVESLKDAEDELMNPKTVKN